MYGVKVLNINEFKIAEGHLDFLQKSINFVMENR